MYFSEYEHAWSVQKTDNELCHHGIKGQKWGIRRWQNEDGSLTEEGKQRYNAGYKWGIKSYETDDLRAKALLGLGFKGVLKYGKYVRDKNKKAFENKYGKTKEEQEKNLKKEWDELTKKETADLELGKKMKKFDKLNPTEQDTVRKQVKSEIDSLLEKNSKRGGLGHDDTKKLDGLADWYMQDCDKRIKQIMAPLDKPFDNRVVSQDEGQVQLHKNPKYENLYKHVLESTKKESDANWEAAGEYNKKKNAAETIKSSEANLKYWTKVSQSTLDYVKKNFPAEERDRAIAFVLWNLYD